MRAAVVVGQLLLTALDIRLLSLQVAGGVILFLLGLQMLFSGSDQTSAGRTVMTRIPALIPITDFRQDAVRAAKQVQRPGDPVITTQSGPAAAAMPSVEAFEQGERGRQMLRLLTRGDQDIGEGRGWSLDAVLAEADRSPRDAGR